MEAGGTVHTKAGRGALFICISFVFSFCKTGGECLRRLQTGRANDVFQSVAACVLASANAARNPARGANLRRGATLASALTVGAAGVAAVPFDPPLSFPMDLASCWPPTAQVDALVEVALHARDEAGWLTQRRARTELPED